MPEILNSDRDCHLISNDRTVAMPAMGTKVSKDGYGRWLDKVFIERQIHSDLPS